MTNGLVAVSSEASPFLVNKNGIAAVTGWLSGEFWASCYDAISTSWSACYSAPATTWTDSAGVIVTVWTKT